MAAIEVNHLHQNFGKQQILKDVSFEVPEKAIFGFLGKNGAGKTTTMKIMLGLLKPTSGTVKIFDESVAFGQTKTNRFVGYLPDVPEFYDFMKPQEYLKLCGEITHMPAAKIKERSAELLELVGLEKEQKKIGGFSRGMKQRLGIAQALLNEPRLLICDEPTSALDPLGRKEILEILLRIKNKTTVLFSTHILADVDKICDHVAILDQGEIVLNGAIQTLKNQQQQETILLEFKDDRSLKKFRDSAAQSFTIEQQNSEQLKISTLHADQTIFALMQLLNQQQLVPVKLEIQEPTLEDLFLEVVK